MKDGKRVWSMGGKLSTLQETSIDTVVAVELGKAYSVTGCVETTHYMGKTKEFAWPGGKSYNFVEPFSVWLRFTDAGPVIVGALPHSSCTFHVLSADELAAGRKPVGDDAIRFPEQVANPVAQHRDGMTPALFTRPAVDVVSVGGRLRIQVRTAPLPELNTKGQTVKEFGQFREQTPKDDYVIWWRVVGKEPEPPQGPASGGGQTGG